MTSTIISHDQIFRFFVCVIRNDCQFDSHMFNVANLSHKRAVTSVYHYHRGQIGLIIIEELNWKVACQERPAAILVLNRRVVQSSKNRCTVEDVAEVAKTCLNESIFAKL